VESCELLRVVPHRIDRLESNPNADATIALGLALNHEMHIFPEELATFVSGVGR
jgi:hypothetical protein